ncbi:hypothetical protein U9M48_003855 [Paspalum notatum var. saurae]|uniref:Uncharacterized protein n=1 Tax=Paspalum notatum var. saurae TaxID=547442 RepID=A0AAQ3PLR1_PASNO
MQFHPEAPKEYPEGSPPLLEASEPLLGASTRAPSRLAAAARRRPSPLLRRRTRPPDVVPPVEFEEQPLEASVQQQEINFEEGKYNINTTQ